MVFPGAGEAVTLWRLPLGVVLVGQPHRRAADLQAEWPRTSLWFFPFLLPAEGCEIQVVVTIVEFRNAPKVE